MQPHFDNNERHIWLESETLVPKGYIRFLGKFAEPADSEVKLYLLKKSNNVYYSTL